MKKYLKISNKGLLDIRLVALMGGTTKSGNIYKIGQFGTGLKYTLAYLFRNSVDFKILVGNREVSVSIETEEISNEIFEIICIEGNRTSITTKMGMDWKPWMIVRELYSNALDEGEAHYSVVDKIEGKENTTSFFIELTTEFLQVYNDWGKYFIVDNIPAWENETFAVHPCNGKLRIYKQGIMIHEGEQNSVFNYDVKDASINELREYKGTLSLDISTCLFRLEDPKTIEYFLENVTEEMFEGKMDYDWMYNGTFNETWRRVIGNAKLIHKEAKQRILGSNPLEKFSDCIEVPKALFKALTKVFDGIGALRVVNKLKEFYEIHDEDLSLLVKKSLTILEESGYFIHPELIFVFGEFGDKSTLAQVNLDKKEILISQKMKDKSLFEFCAMLIEENEHFQTGLSDCTREFQQHFINLYTKTLLSKAKIEL